METQFEAGSEEALVEAGILAVDEKGRVFYPEKVSDALEAGTLAYDEKGHVVFL